MGEFGPQDKGPQGTACMDGILPVSICFCLGASAVEAGESGMQDFYLLFLLYVFHFRRLGFNR